ncbi:MAG TPA: serine/threonine-protein kinase [Pseudonocardia sp.]
MPLSGSAPETPEEAEPRRIAGRYRLTGPLGSGAMGTVWAGYDEVLHRAVAIKELRVPPGVPEGEISAMRERMMREARTLGGLSHPNVITLYDVVDVAGEPIVVMELLPSRNLSEVIAEHGRLSGGQAASIGLATAAALQAAHRAGITHRDVKPGNVLVADDGRIKLTDFGIARKSDDVTMTQTGLVLGSPAYIAPEVASGLPVTPAADLWGLGATLFAAVEARPPYDVDGDPVKTVTAVVHAQVPRPRIGGPLAEVIAALMVKDPDHRMPLVEVRRRLRPLLRDPDDPLFPGSVDAFSPPPGPDTERIGEQPRPGRRGGFAEESGVGSSAAVSSARLGAEGSSRFRVGSDTGPRKAPAGAAALAPEPGPLPRPPGSPSGPSGHSGPQAGRGAPPRPNWQQPGPTSMPGRPPVQRPMPPPALATGSAGLPARRALPLVLAGALAVVLGAGGGWLGTRVLAGQQPLTTAVASPVTVAASPPLTTHQDSAERYGSGALGFTAPVPVGWEEYRMITGETPVVRFVSPDGARELRVQKLIGTRSKPARAAEVAAGLTPAALGVTSATVRQNEGNQLEYLTERAGSQGTTRRANYVQLVPAGSDLWVLQLSVPADRTGEPVRSLLTGIAESFKP